MRNIWWVAVFFLVLAVFTFPVILLSQQYKFEISIYLQAIIVLITSVICQRMRRHSFNELLGTPGFGWIKELFKGLLLGGGLMFAPAICLWLMGVVSWQQQTFDGMSLINATAIFVFVSIAEELLFRGFVFQRFVGGIGIWPAQIIMAAYFLLNHINNPGIEGNIKLLAGFNIFLASILFGFAFIKTGSLAMPIGIHFMANWTQGVLLGFGVSGNEQVSFLKPVFKETSPLLTGGKFGLEASLPGLLFLILFLLILYKWKPVSRPKDREIVPFIPKKFMEKSQ